MQMLESLLGIINQRKLRLFACACCRRIWPLLSDERSRQAVEVAQRHADGLANDEELAVASFLAQEAFHSIPWEPGGQPGAIKLAASAVWGATVASTCESFFGDRPDLGFAINTALQARDATDNPEAEQAEQAELLRDVFGNPFCQVRVAPCWRTAAVISVAMAVYLDSRFDGLPILADGLEEAGCTERPILDHLRGPGRHVRGCWPVDLLLAKE
jgi:hypothetical protein